MSSASNSEVTVRPATPEDAAVCGQICYQAFYTINEKHGFPCDFPGPEASTGLLSMMFSSPGHYCVVAERAGRVVGSNVLDERSVIAGVGPVTIDPGTQNVGIGRKLMNAVIERANSRSVAGIRLVQTAFHGRSLSLYSSLGFDVREPLSCLQGAITQRSIPGCDVRSATPADFEACNHLSRRIHGFERAAELSQAIEHGTARVVQRAGRMTGYTSHMGFFGHSTAETNLDLQALIASADSFAGPGILMPSRNHALLRWCLGNGLRVVQPMTLMTMGLYNEPTGAWLPSVIY
jgi:predicted N-acetyltransferase YhbS